MNLSEERQALLALLGYALFGREASVSAGGVDWERVIAQADRHVVTAFLYPGVKRMAGAPEAVVHRARNAAMLAAARADDMLYIQDEVVACLRERGIPCAVLKGFGAACRYPHPELRMPGDIDLLVGEANADAARAALEQRGFRYEHETDMHISLAGRGVELEIHRSASVFPENEKGRYARAYMEGALQAVEQGAIREHAFPVLSLPHQLVSLLAHTERHMGSAGIGLRQICDWAVTVHARRDEIGAAELEQLERCGLLCFAKVITRMCERHMGLAPLAWTRGAPDELADAVLLDIFQSGNFHVQDARHRVGSSMMARAGEGGERSSVVINYIRNVRERVRQDYKWAKSPLWIPLFCAFYPIRWLYRVLRGRRRFVSIPATIAMAKSRERMIRGLRLYR